MTRKTSFYYSFLALPPPKRAAITAVFDWCRAVDDSVDLESDPARARAAIAAWRAETARVFEGVCPETPQGTALQPFVAPMHLPRDQFDALNDGVAMDIDPIRFQTFADLEPYCHRVASSVGLMCAEIFGYHEASVKDYARDLGVALQLTNILRDVGVDFRRGKIYLPLDDLARFGCGEADIEREVTSAGRGLQSEAMRSVLATHAARAKVFFDRARRSLPREDAASFLPAEIMHAIYADLLKKIEAARYDVFTRLIRVPRPRQAQLALAVWWRLHRLRP